jgi:hypothetical protein
VIPGNAARTGSLAVRIEASTPLMRWYCVKTVPPTSSTAVTMTVSLGLAAGTPAIDVPANATTAATHAAVIRHLFHETPFPIADARAG